MIELWAKDKIPFFNEKLEDNVPYLTYYPAKNSRSCVIVCPGGAYIGKSVDHEGIKIAEAFNKNDISAFVLSYRVAPHRFPAPLYDVVRAVKHVRFHADKYGVDTDKIAVLGFSAGGHLASMSGTLYNYPEIRDDVDGVSGRPDGLVLCYPVIQWGTYEHTGSRLNLIGDDKCSLYNLTNTALQINENTPPTFLWTTAEDTAVPPMNSFLFASQLVKAKVPCELHMYPTGIHGSGLAEDNSEAANWFAAAVSFLKTRCFG